MLFSNDGSSPNDPIIEEQEASIISEQQRQQQQQVGASSQKLAHREKDKRHRKRKSEIWEWFTLVENNGTVKCLKCGWGIKYSGSTTACREHIKKCPGIRAAKLEKGYVDPEILNAQQDGNNWIYDNQGNLKRQCLPGGSGKASDLSMTLNVESEAFEVRADIATAKAKLYQAEAVGMPDIIRVYGDLLTELLRKENSLRRIDNQRSRQQVSYEGMVFILGYLSLDGLICEPLGTAFSVSPRCVLTAASVLDIGELPAGRFVLSSQMTRAHNSSSGRNAFLRPRSVRLIRSCGGAEGWAMLELDGIAALPTASLTTYATTDGVVVDWSSSKMDTSALQHSSSSAISAELVDQEDCFSQYLPLCPANHLPQPNREEGHLLSLHHAPIDWYQRTREIATKNSLSPSVESMRVWSSFGRPILQRDGGGGIGAVDTRILIQGGTWLGSGGAPFVNDFGQVVAMQLFSYRDVVSSSADDLSDSRSLFSTPSVICVGLLLSAVSELQECVRQAGGTVA